MEIRKLIVDDMEKVIALYKKTAETIDNENWFRGVDDDEWLKLIHDGCLYGGFVEDGGLVAISALELDIPSYEFSPEFSLASKPVGEIGYFMVDRDFRGKGIMNILNLHLLEEAKKFGFKSLCASMHPSNIPAIKSFSKLGKLEFFGMYNALRENPRVVYGINI